VSICRTVVPGGLLFFFLFQREISELRRPIAVKLCHVIRSVLNFINQVPKFAGPPPQIFGAKTCKIRDNFILHNFGKLQSPISPVRLRFLSV